ncbi:MAG TPA: tRNA lysidine(34) synthetase TilS [Chthoniobacterales bacterium]|nr:tRNA lysidine(34) synthetase TilS [Chthoniobacterales bacterium]
MNQIQNKNLLRQFSPDRQYLIAVSGGRDSVALLHWLIDSGYKKLIVCHLNHQLRGAASSVDARFVEKLAAKYDIDLAIESVNVRALATKTKMSIEAAARDMRYKFFARVAKRWNCRTIFIGHHADDVVETFLINLFRGSGTTGLAGIRNVSTRQVGGVDLKIVRPFLGIWRREINEYVRAQDLKYREDASNKDLAPLRNRLRHRVIPYLEKALRRNIRQSIWRAAMIAIEEDIWIENQLPSSTGTEFPAAKIRDLPIALQRRQILNWLRAQNIINVGFDVVESIRALLEPNSSVAKVNLPRDRHVRRRAKKIFIE